MTEHLHNPPDAPPLAGLRILELGTMISVPYAAMLLAEQGAEVIKVEPPTGDQSRHADPQWNGMAAYFYNLNRGKRSVVLDLKTSSDRAVIQELISTADVVMENWRPGVAKGLGLDWDQLRSQFPRLITVSVRGYAESGPYAQDRVYDPIVQGVSAMACGQGGAQSPSFVRTYLPDKLASLGAAHGVLAALYKRERTGRGSHVALSMLDATVNFLWPDGMMYHTFRDAPLDSELARQPGPRVAHLIQAGDEKWVVFTAVTREQWFSLCDALEVLTLAPQYESGSERKRHNAAISEALTAACRHLSRDEVLLRLRKADVPCGPVNTADEMLSDPQILSNGTVEELERPHFGRVREPRGLVQVGASERHTLGPAPTLGEHTAEILRELGFQHPDGAIEHPSG